MNKFKIGQNFKKLDSSETIFEITRLTNISIFYKVIEKGNLDFKSRISKNTFPKRYKMI